MATNDSGDKLFSLIKAVTIGPFAPIKTPATPASKPQIKSFAKPCLINLFIGTQVRKRIEQPMIKVRIYSSRFWKINIAINDPINEAHKIAEFTNSQNPVKPVDLKSLASEQIEIERYLDEHDIAYARKSGDTGPCEDKEYKYTINMETFGKLLKARGGNPEKATSSVKDIFENSYEKLFIDNFVLDESPALIERYFKIIKMYKNKKLKGNQLKYFYMIYLDTFEFGVELSVVIDFLEEVLNKYTKENEVSVVKALGSVSFKKSFINSIKERFSEDCLV